MDLIARYNNRIIIKKLILSITGINIDEPNNKGHFFTKEVERIQSYNPEKYWDTLLYFNYLLEQFNKISKHNKLDFDYFLNEFSVDGDNLRGQKFEIQTYIRLLNKGLQFSKITHPDFEIQFSDGAVFIECATRQRDKEGTYIKSVEGKIIEKQTKGKEQSYANYNTALHIEISNPIYNSFGKEDFLDTPVLEQILNRMIKEVTFGAIVLIHHFYAKEDGIVYGHPVIKYHDKCNPNLKMMHDLMFELKLVRVSKVLKSHI